VADREAQLVKLTEDPRERYGDVAIDNELAGVDAAVEAPLRDGDEAQPCQRNRAAGVPKAILQLRA
jgi:hypothetical protein